jgi:GntR family transcriptional regulator
MLNENAPMALYHQLREVLLNKIKSNEWPVNSQIPSERELCETFGVSRITVRKALSELEREGYLYRKQGKGTFVTSPKIEQRLSRFYSFSEEIRKMGYVPSSKILDFTVMQADKNIAANLQIESGVDVYSLRRIRLANEEPFAIENSFIPCVVCPGLSAEEIAVRGLYGAMRLNYGLIANQAVETFEAVSITADEALHLTVAENAPGLLLERVTYSNMVIVEYCRSIIRGDRYKYRIVLK